MTETMAFSPRKILSGKEYTLVPFEEGHISDRYIGWLNNPQVNRFLEVRFVHQTRDTVLEYVRAFNSDKEKYLWMIYHTGGDEPVGTASLDQINRRHGTGIIGVMIGEPAYWGKGASAGSIQLMTEFAFNMLKLRRLMAGSYATNHGMNFTYKQLGWTLEGKLRKAYLQEAEHYVNSCIWGLLAEEWKKLKEKEKL